MVEKGDAQIYEDEIFQHSRSCFKNTLDCDACEIREVVKSVHVTYDSSKQNGHDSWTEQNNKCDWNQFLIPEKPKISAV